jgi:23S rRNA (cytidine1920-2'-O)/16S rRNA (cytidine1409-2'-O)-methyltransferase
VARGLVPSRARAQDLIGLGHVTIDGRPARKAGELVGPDTAIALGEAAHRFVSRGALKLAAALDASGLSPHGRDVLDLGASTGGFVEVLLERGAARVIAVDVGHGQLHPRLRGDPRVVAIESKDARALSIDDLPGSVDAVTTDLSFISLTLVLPHVLTFARPGAWLVALVKPQFEAGRAAVGKGGIVRESADRARSVARVRGCIDALPGWRVLGEMRSPIAGQDGNEEWLLWAEHSE